MDVLAHALWANAAFYKKYKTDKKKLFLSAFFGVLPDLISFSPIFIYRFLINTSVSIFDMSTPLAQYAHESYNFTHSLIIWAIVILVVTAIRKWKFWWPMFGAVLHILIDIPTHKGFYETPFLFPISDYRFSYGISWGDQTFMIVNYTCLAAVYIFIFYLSRKSIIKT